MAPLWWVPVPALGARASVGPASLSAVLEGLVSLSAAEGLVSKLAGPALMSEVTEMPAVMPSQFLAKARRLPPRPHLAIATT